MFTTYCGLVTIIILLVVLLILRCFVFNSSYLTLGYRLYILLGVEFAVG